MQAHLPRALRAFGLNVRKKREASGLTQERAGEKANLDPTYISGIERGARNLSIHRKPVTMHEFSRLWRLSAGICG